MVVEPDRVGAQVICPNCRRTLKVPTGKDRGVQLAAAPAATKTRTSRLCQRCGKEVPVDSQMCPHCKAILLDGPPAAAPAAAKAAPARAPAAQEGPEIIYGGARGSWFSRLSPGGKAGVLGGALAFLAVLGAAIYFVGTSWYAAQVAEARQQGQVAIDKGRKFEEIGKFQEAYEMYWAALIPEKYLRQTGDPKDAQLADHLKARAIALQYLVADPKVRRGESVYWKPKNQPEYDQAMAHLRETYPAYRQWVLAAADAGLVAVQFGKTNPGQAAFEEKVGAAMDTYVKLVSQTTDQQRAQRTFQQLLSGLKELTSATRNWTNAAARDIYLKSTEGYLSAAKDYASKSEDDLWER
jgi:hypothetical protein